MVKEVLNVERKKVKKLKIVKMEVISKEEYLKVHYGDRKDYFRLDKSRLKPMKFSIGDVIHTIENFIIWRTVREMTLTKKLCLLTQK